MMLKHVAKIGKRSVLYYVFLKTLFVSKVNKPCIAYRLSIHRWSRNVIRIKYGLLVTTAKEMLFYSSD
jgi:hypothetical protein